MFSFKERYPDFYNGMLNRILYSDFIEEQAKRHDMYGSPYSDYMNGAIGGVEDFLITKVTSPDPLIDMCRDCYNEEYHAENKIPFEDRFIDDNGIFDLEKFQDEVSEIGSWLDAFTAELYHDNEIRDAIDDVLYEMEQEEEYDEPEQDEEER